MFSTIVQGLGAVHQQQITRTPGLWKARVRFCDPPDIPEMFCFIYRKFIGLRFITKDAQP